MNDYAKFGM